LAANTGLSSEEIKAAASDGPVSGIAPDYVLVCRAVDELSTRVHGFGAPRGVWVAAPAVRPDGLIGEGASQDLRLFQHLAARRPSALIAGKVKRVHSGL
jgi:hypothetical protein